MSWPTILYFASIFFTFLLTGFLAWYAWRQPALPGVRMYAWMALSECLLALAEMLSMLGGSQGSALFWYKTRFIFTAIIPVFWLIFALEYNGYTDWLTKRLKGGMFILPLITQLIIWSNSLHELWVKQDVAFHQNGFLWIAETAARVPGIWFMVHTVYSILLMIAGGGVFLLTVWKQQQAYRGQAFLLILGTSISLLAGIISIFKLFPHLEFNPFTPGVGMAALVYALAIFRTQFLASAPKPRSIEQMTTFERQEKRSLVILIFIFILFTSGATASGYLTYQNYKEHFREQVESEISAIAELKVNELVDWRKERMADAEVLRKNPVLAALVKHLFESPSDVETQDQLQAWLASYRTYSDYDRVRLIDVQGHTYLSDPAGLPSLSSEIIQQIPEVLNSGQVKMVDFYRSTDKSIYLGMIIPIVDENAGGQIIGLIVFSIDPQSYLYPFIQEWPEIRTSAETLIVRRDGDDVVYLNPLRSQADAALNLRFPLDQTELPAVKAALGEEGMVEGLDYRGEDVIAELRAVPNSPWFLISKMDAAEVYAPLRERFWLTILFFGTLIIMAGAGLMLVWRQQRVRYYKAQAEISESLRASEEKFRLAFDISPDAITISRMEDGTFISVNKGFEQLTGYSRDDTLRKTALELPLWKNPEDRNKIIEELRAKGEVDNFESVFLTQHGEVYGLLSAVILPLNGKPHILSIARDITERKQAEKQLLKTLEELERSNTELEQFAYVASHDLQEPLRAVAGMVQLLQKRYQGKLDDRADEYIHLAMDGANRMQTLITDLLEYSRVDRRGNPIQPADANETLKFALRNLEESIQQSGATVTNEIMPMVEADATQLTQLFQNLISNAIKFHGERPPQIHIKVEQLPDAWHFSVSDNGIGIEPQYFERIFLIFQRLHTRRKYSGTGIGLSICKKIVERHGGRIWVESEFGQGTTFHFTIPHRS